MKFFHTERGKILTIVILIMIIGSINVLSASYALASSSNTDATYFLIKYVVFAIFGLIGAWIISKINYRFWLKSEVVILTIGGLIALLLVVHFFGATENGATRWILLGGFSLQPSELVKIGVITILTSYLAPLMFKGQKASLFSPEFICVIIMGALVYKQPDLGTAAIIVALGLGMICICGLPRWQYGMVCVGVLVSVYYFSSAASYRAARIKAWLDPWAYQTSDGYQSVQALLAIGSGGASGRGFGQGISKFFYLPEAHTDFAFAVYCQETGFLGAIILISCFVYLCLLLHKVTKETQDAQTFFLLVGMNLLITGQAVANIAMVTGLLPVIGVPLPFVSYGGTSMLSLLCSLGILANALGSKRMIHVNKPTTPSVLGSKNRLRRRRYEQ